MRFFREKKRRKQEENVLAYAPEQTPSRGKVYVFNELSLKEGNRWLYTLTPFQLR